LYAIKLTAYFQSLYKHGKGAVPQAQPYFESVETTAWKYLKPVYEATEDKPQKLLTFADKKVIFRRVCCLELRSYSWKLEAMLASLPFHDHAFQIWKVLLFAYYRLVVKCAVAFHFVHIWIALRYSILDLRTAFCIVIACLQFLG
jgi:hypothetical protein